MSNKEFHQNQLFLGCQMNSHMGFTKGKLQEAPDLCSTQECEFFLTLTMSNNVCMDNMNLVENISMAPNDILENRSIARLPQNPTSRCKEGSTIFVDVCDHPIRLVELVILVRSSFNVCQKNLENMQSRSKCMIDSTPVPHLQKESKDMCLKT